jgi:hypothetical protein
MNGAQPFPQYASSMYPEWYVHLGRDGWIVGYWLNDPNPANQPPRPLEFMGREWMDKVANDIGAKGGSVKYSVEPGEGDPPPIVLTMIHFLSDTLNERLAYHEPGEDDGSIDKHAGKDKHAAGAKQAAAGEDSDADMTVLMRKARDGNLAWVADLIERGADLESADDRGCTALMHAAYAGHLEVVQALLEAGADPNRGSKKGNTALMMAVQCPVQRQEHRAEVARVLLARKADPNVVNKEKQTALDLCDRRDQRVIFILREFGANHAHELEPWWDRPWVKYPVVGLFGLAACVALFWYLFAYVQAF